MNSNEWKNRKVPTEANFLGQLSYQLALELLTRPARRGGPCSPSRGARDPDPVFSTIKCDSGRRGWEPRATGEHSREWGSVNGRGSCGNFVSLASRRVALAVACFTGRCLGCDRCVPLSAFLLAVMNWFFDWEVRCRIFDLNFNLLAIMGGYAILCLCMATRIVCGLLIWY